MTVGLWEHAHRSHPEVRTEKWRLVEWSPARAASEETEGKTSNRKKPKTVKLAPLRGTRRFFPTRLIFVQGGAERSRQPAVDCDAKASKLDDVFVHLTNA